MYIIARKTRAVENLFVFGVAASTFGAHWQGAVCCSDITRLEQDARHCLQDQLQSAEESTKLCPNVRCHRVQCMRP